MAVRHEFAAAFVGHAALHPQEFLAAVLARLPADVLVQDRDTVSYYDLRHWLA